jgi:hypothetical protein
LEVTDEKSANRFYRLVYFSPRPEDDERVCVGILLFDSGHAELEFDENLDKAHCFAPDYTRASLRFVLETLRSQSKRAALEGRINEFSPQIQLSAERILRHGVNDKIREILRQKYLMKPKAADHKTRQKGKGPGKHIDFFLAEHFDLFSGAVQRGVGPQDLFGAATRELPADIVPRTVSRAVVSEHAVCLLDGVDLHVDSTEALVRRVDRVARTFWQYRKAQEFLGASQTPKILRAALIFDGDGPEVEASLKWRQDYAMDQFKKNANVTVKAGSREQERELQGELRKMHLLTSGD